MPSPLLSRAALALAAAVATLAACSKHAPDDALPATSTAMVGGDITPDNVPPAMAGVWTSRRGEVMRCIELHADGTYLMVPNTDAGDRTGFHGTWRVAGDQITWRDASMNFRADVNPLVDVSAGRFTTIEVDRSRTKFDRIAGPESSCPRS